MSALKWAYYSKCLRLCAFAPLRLCAFAPLRLNCTYDLTSTSTLGYLRKGEGRCHSMTSWLELRRNYAAYYDFYTYLLSLTVGKRNFKIRLNTMAEGEEIATISDEALALLRIENGHKLWDDTWEKSAGKVRVIRKQRRALPRGVELDCLPPVHPDFESRPSD
jgi:hypothetical protein